MPHSFLSWARMGMNKPTALLLTWLAQQWEPEPELTE
jgi:hypothetical protein